MITFCRGYQDIQAAATLGHSDGEVEIAFGHLAGVHLPLQIAKAQEIFEKHAHEGNAKAQAVS